MENNQNNENNSRDGKETMSKVLVVTTSPIVGLQPYPTFANVVIQEHKPLTERLFDRF